MSQPSDQEVVMSAPEGDPLADYRPLCGWAVVSPVLGLLSVFTVFSGYLWFLPLLGVIVSIVALVKIRRSPDPMRGTAWALAGLLLAAAFGAGAASYRTARVSQLRHTGKRFADAWIQLVRDGELRKAHQLHRLRDARKHPRADFDVYYQDENTKKDFERFFQQAPLSTIVEVGNEGEIEYVAPDPTFQERRSGVVWDVVTFRYRLKYRRGGRTRTVPFTITLGRKIDEKTGEGLWHVYAVKEPPSITAPDGS